MFVNEMNNCLLNFWAYHREMRVISARLFSNDSLVPKNSLPFVMCLGKGSGGVCLPAANTLKCGKIARNRK